ncbi:MAG: hypothetical protein KatS3mg079_586 [Caloramator sp.]|uniref:Superfamily II DNA/RNA helicase required for DNA uptake (Late competence protein) n=1 Tax=Caloramator proteoclasticus DSM 10124 TaxID=1121262 RepID=A0A1M4SCW3_9CLOT|nr:MULTISPECIES: hypothetical protein [Caloramator]GIW49110.1 MAG: hypothetical protein KatS3mg079_586 [Caloramator sp.]SHE30064.1 Superfamily II DNA/RNA helicase required for DNA uptake (late competence protein) [Caloramator proteoclasticus DSM 10124]
MEVYLYKARGKGGSIYDITLNPQIDFEVLRKIRGITNIEILTDKIDLCVAEEIINQIYSGNFIGRFISLQEYYLNKILKSYGIKKESRFITSGKPIPKVEDLERIEEYIKGKIISFRYLMELDEIKNMDYELVIDVIQTLYCERRIKYTKAVKTIKNKEVCFLCEKEKCDVCNFEHIEDDILLYAADNYNNLKPPHIEPIINRSSIATVNTLKEVTEFIKSKREKSMLLSSPKAFSIDVLIEAVYEVLKVGGRVLYITSPKFINEAKQEFQSKINGARVEIVLGRKAKLVDCEIIVTSYTDYPCFYKSFDLVIFDKRLIFLDLTSLQDEIFKKAKKERGKFLKISVSLNEEDKKEYKDLIYMPVDGIKKPMPEPMNIISRYLDGTEDFMPQMAIDFILFTISKKNNLIIFVPDEGYIQKVYYILSQTLNIDTDLIEYSTHKDKDGLFRFMKKEGSILISSDAADAYLSYENTNVIIMYSDNRAYTLEAIIYMCQIPMNFQGKKIGEVYFVSCQETENMQIAKSTIRILNKVAWEKGYLKK